MCWTEAITAHVRAPRIFVLTVCSVLGIIEQKQRLGETPNPKAQNASKLSSTVMALCYKTLH